MLPLGTNSRSLLLHELPTPGSSHLFSEPCTALFFLNVILILFIYLFKNKQTTQHKNCILSPLLALVSSAETFCVRVIACPPPQPTPPPSQWACGISPSHSLADWVIPSDFLQMCSSIRFLTAWDWDIALPGAAFPFPFCWQIRIVLRLLSVVATCEGICNGCDPWSADAARPASRPALIALLSHRGASTVQSFAALIVNEASASVYGHGLFWQQQGTCLSLWNPHLPRLSLNSTLHLMPLWEPKHRGLLGFCWQVWLP